MAAPHMKTVAKYVTMFITLQKSNKDSEGNPSPVYDMFNVEDAKWTMRDMMTQIDDNALFEKVIRFYMIVDDNKTWDEFKYHYHEYLDKWLEFKANHDRKKYMQNETINKGKQNGS